MSAEAPIPLSVLIRSRNEEDRIGDAIRSALPLGAEILVVDSGSTDRTIAIARDLGARVVHNDWPGFGPQRHFGEGQCANDFVFSLDADELLTPELTGEIRRAFLSGPPPKLMIVRKAMIFPHNKKPPPFGYCAEQVLIYDRRVARTGPNPNWDQLEISIPEKPVRLHSPLWHFSLRDWHHGTAKLNYVAMLAARTQKPRPRWELLARLVLEFPAAFIKFYFVRRYCLGGVDGFAMAVVSAYGRWLRIAMMLEQRDHGI